MSSPYCCITELVKNRRYTCDFTSESLSPLSVVSTKRKPSILIQPLTTIQPQIHSLGFWFKYNSDNGLLIYAPNMNESFFGMELYDGEFEFKLKHPDH